jgi:late competence protein required for DNA uptake (superfamily II DNA/RNA helicase)
MELNIQGTPGEEELISCQRCGETKPRSAYRQVAHPTICRECYVAKRREGKQAQVPQVPEGAAKHRVGVYLSPQSRAVLSVLAIRYKSDSAVVEQLLLRAYDDMSPQEKAIVAYVQQSM